MTATYRDVKKSRDERVGASFKPDQRYEYLLAMPESRREDILKGSSTLRISLGHYRAARDAAQRLATLDKEMTA